MFLHALSPFILLEWRQCQVDLGLLVKDNDPGLGHKGGLLDSKSSKDITQEKRQRGVALLLKTDELKIIPKLKLLGIKEKAH